MIAIDPNPQNTSHTAHPEGGSENIRRIRPLVEDRLLELILLDYLAAATPIHLPGGEGMRICDILHEYQPLSLSGIVPTRSELLARHPELTEAIARFFVETTSL